MHLAAEFDGKPDVDINRDVNPRFDWFTDNQSQSDVKWRHNDVMGKEWVNHARLFDCYFWLLFYVWLTLPN